ncbi:MAG: hypothetical protein IPP40_16090 [bacterium]|nr:hypothetical protein [bacterium]
MVHPYTTSAWWTEFVPDGHGTMDESYLDRRTVSHVEDPAGSNVISGSINGEAALTIKATARAEDSRYAKIMEVMRVGAKLDRNCADL